MENAKYFKSGIKTNSTLGIKTGLQKPKPLKTSTADHFSNKLKSPNPVNGEIVIQENNPFIHGSCVEFQNMPKGKLSCSLFECFARESACLFYILMPNSPQRHCLMLSFVVEDVLQLFENVTRHLSNKNFDVEVVTAIIILNSALKIHGENLEVLNKARMDKFQVCGK